MDTTAPSTVTGYTTLAGTTTGSVTVLDGGTLIVGGTHDGSVVVEGGGTLLVQGALRGAVEVGSLATATVSGDLVGKVEIRIAGTLAVEAGGRLAGPVTNYGSFTNHGMRSGPVEGREPDDSDGSEVLEPLHPGIYNYVLPAR
ncbi:MAG: hypothetical protein JWR04_399 [Rhodoglobus sp.]|jgi:hypothetical protein|nr:hypothetical protein [Rhodoglobus sp.]